MKRANKTPATAKSRPKGTLYFSGGTWKGRLQTTRKDGAGNDVVVRPNFDLGTDQKSKARRIMDRIAEAIERGEDPEKIAPVVGGEPETFASYATAWHQRRHARGVVSASDDLQRLQDHIFPVIGPMSVRAVKARNVRDVLDEAVEKGLASQTVQHIRKVMFQVFRDAVVDELVETNPVEKVRTPEIRAVKKERVILLAGEFERLMTHLNALVRGGIEPLETHRFAHATQERRRQSARELRAMCACAPTMGGMRTSDINRWDWVMLDAPVFTKAVIPRSKTGAPQELEIPAPLRPYILDWWEAAGRPTSGPVFPVRRGKRSGKARVERGTSYAKRLRQACRAAGLTRPELYEETTYTLPLDFHGFRRLFATRSGAAGVPVQVSAALANHADLATHQRYILDQDPVYRRIPAGVVPPLPTLSVSATVSGHEPSCTAMSDGGAAEEIAESLRATQDSNLRPSAPEADALSS